MPPINPNGNQTFWYDGESFEGLQKNGGPDTGAQVFWYDGRSTAALSDTNTGVAEGDSEAVGAGEAIFVGTGVAEGDSEAEGAGINEIGDGLAEGDSEAVGAGESRLGYTAFGAYTYTPLTAPPDFELENDDEGTDPESVSPRRRPEIQVVDGVNGAAGSLVFSIGGEDAPIGGQGIIGDVGEGVFFEGSVVKTTRSFEGQRDQPITHVVCTDYSYLLNRRRPFACFEENSVTDIVESLVEDFAEGFTAEVDADLPVVNDILFDGSQDFTVCLTQLATMIGAHHKLRGKVVVFTMVDDAEGPAVIDDDNMDLLYEPAISITEDMTQLRTRVFVKGAGARVIAPAAVGAELIEIEGEDFYEKDIFANGDGGEVIVGCQVLKYAGRRTVSTTVPRDVPANVTTIGEEEPASIGGGNPGGIQPVYVADEFGNIRNVDYVRYTSTWVRPEGESGFGLEGVRQFEHLVTPPVALNITEILFDDGQIQGSGNWAWLESFVLADGSDVMQAVSAGVGLATGFTGTFGVRLSLQSAAGNDLVLKKRLWRTSNGTDGPHYLVAEYPKGTTTWVDRVPDDNLITQAPRLSSINSGVSGLARTYNTAGRIVRVILQPLSSSNPGDTTPTARKIYRKVRPVFGQNEQRKWEYIATVDVNDDEYFDNKAVDPYLNEGFSPEPVPPDPPGQVRSGPTPAPPPTVIVKHYLYGIPSSGAGSIQHQIEAGAMLNIWHQEDDLEMQTELAVREGGNGIHEYVVNDPSITSKGNLKRRAQAELAMFGRPIKTVVWGTRDENTVTGKEQEFNLTDPPIVGTFKIVDVQVDEIHEASGEESLVERRIATASSVRFTLDDLLRRVMIGN